MAAVFIRGEEPNIYPEECITHLPHEDETFASFACGDVEQKYPPKQCVLKFIMVCNISKESLKQPKQKNLWKSFKRVLTPLAIPSFREIFLYISRDTSTFAFFGIFSWTN